MVRRVTSGLVCSINWVNWRQALAVLVIAMVHSARAQTPVEARTALQQDGLLSELGESKKIFRPIAASEVAYWYGANYRTPFVMIPGTNKAADIARHAIEYKQANSWKRGGMFADVMVNQSSMAEPAASGGAGATEFYATLRGDVGFRKATGSPAFRRGPLREISIELGANLETKNSSYAPAERTLYFGPKLQFAVPAGYFNVGLHLRKEWNHEGVLGRPEDYDPDFNVEPAWLLPFRFGRAHLVYTGFADYNTQKGRDSFGNPTVGEFLVRNYVAFDIGGLLLHKPQVVDLNCGFWYWHNEYGKPSSDPDGSQMTPMFGMTVHLGKAGGMHEQ